MFNKCFNNYYYGWKSKVDHAGRDDLKDQLYRVDPVVDDMFVQKIIGQRENHNTLK